jgi:hypothetical protein
VKMGKSFFASSNIYETFSPFNILLCACGFWHNGVKAEGKHNASVGSIKVLLSVMFSLFFLTLLIWNVYWGEQEPEHINSTLLKHGSHKLYFIELLLLQVIIWSNFRNRREIFQCLQLIDRYDVLCQVNGLSFFLFDVQLFCYAEERRLESQSQS